MKIVVPSFQILYMPERSSIVSMIELIGRTCYKSADKMTPDSSGDFVRRLIQSGHHSVLEHVSITVHFVCDRGVSHELVRHRLASYSQESTRYVNYTKEKFGRGLTVIRPFFWPENSPPYQEWQRAMEQAERSYLQLIQLGARPEEARSVLPTSVKTEIVMSCNVREWRHVFDLRCGKASHPQMREIMLPLLDEFHEKIPVLFDDLYARYLPDIQA
ncbi:MAG: FAD-dependent thymidylate synthase [Deltaproteobacteria bacterium]|nr:FAD-dependent thymidylate synthase [Deltaproteobacteria bacterium]